MTTSGAEDTVTLLGAIPVFEELSRGDLERVAAVAVPRRFGGGETRLGQGREAAKDFLKQNPALATEIESKIRSKTNEVAVPVEGIEEAE